MEVLVIVATAMDYWDHAFRKEKVVCSDVGLNLWEVEIVECSAW
jgi:hypothetical protein